MILTPDAYAKTLSAKEVQIFLPQNNKNYLLVAQDQSKCPQKTQHFSCSLKDWVEAINYVCETLGKEAAGSVVASGFSTSSTGSGR